jgi:hypothetical protein
MKFWGKLSWIIGALENAAVVGGFSALSAGLLSIGIPKNNVLDYEEAIKASKFLVIAHGTTDEVGKAKSVLETSGATRVGTHEAYLPTD